MKYLFLAIIFLICCLASTNTCPPVEEPIFKTDIVSPEVYLDSLRQVCDDSLDWAQHLDDVGANIYSFSSDLYMAIQYYELSWTIRADIFKRDPKNEENLDGIIRGRINLANFWQRLGHYEEGKFYLEQSFDFLKQLKQLNYVKYQFRMGRVYHILGQINSEIGSFTDTRSAYFNALELFENNFEYDSTKILRNIGYVNNDISDFFAYLGMPDSALVYANNGINKYEAYFYKLQAAESSNIGLIDGLMSEYANTLRNQASAYYQKGDFSRSIDNYQRVRSIYYAIGNTSPESKPEIYRKILIGEQNAIPQLPNKHTDKKYIELAIAQSLPMMEDVNLWSKLEALLKDALQINEDLRLKEKINLLHYLDAAKCWHNLGNLYHRMGQYKSSLSCQDSALHLLTLPSSSGQKKFLDDFTAIKIFQFRALAEKELGHLEDASKTLEQARGLIQDLIIDWEDNESRKVLRSITQDIYDLAIDIFVDLGKYEKAFYCAEESKGFVLLRATCRNNIIRGIDPNLLIKEKNLRYQLKNEQAYYWKTGNKATLKLLQDLSDNYAALIDELEQNEDYKKVKRQPVFYTLDKLRRGLLNEDRSLIEFYVGLKNTTIFLIQNNGQLQAKQIGWGRNDIRRLEERFYESIYDRYRLLVEIDQAPVGKPIVDLERKAKQLGYQYIETGRVLYDSLLAWFEPKIKEEVLVIADDALNRIPFGAFLTKSVIEKDFALFTTYPFWGKKRKIAYGYSGSLMMEMLTTEVTADELVVVLPQFGNKNGNGTFIEGRTGGLKNIAVNANIFEKFNKQRLILENYRADKSTVIQAMQEQHKYGIGVFITHGIFNDSIPEESFISLSQQDTFDYNEVLFSKELYAFEFQMELLLLMACETNRGQIVPGEGMVSFARAMSFAGVKNIIAPFWSVANNPDLIESFAKDMIMALNDDKKSIVDGYYHFQQSLFNKTDYSDPYLWAGFAYIGIPEKDGFAKIDWGLWGGIILCVVAILFFIMANRYKPKKQ